MKLPLSFAAAAAAFIAPAAALADTSVSYDDTRKAQSGRELPPYLQCVPFARELSGIQIFGDAHSWWAQAEGRYKRGTVPKVGAVMAFEPHRNMKLGHVAAVSKIVDSRTVLLSHSNWSPINGRRGQIERNVRAIDVSPANDWSQVRVWYDPLQAVGKTAWPVHGFIYPAKDKGGMQAGVSPTRVAALSRTFAVTAKPSKKFSQAFANLSAPAAYTPTATARQAPPAKRHDPVLDAINRYEK